MGADDCTCESQCPEADFCGCMYVYEEDRCTCSCGIVIHPSKTLPADAPVAVNTKGIELARLAEFLGKFTADEVLIPASRAREKVSLRMEYTTLAGVLEEVGLVVAGPGPPGPRAAD